ncbi:hypothetical protein RclHR1_12470006 [Rhizophagus clarus]|uniref:Uncharacterized protein n=1 Tax=Rhizophagus clarus TaxID=94130 RepID=A0A2Z6Q8Z1_9GLOM|nr:hypothetical protein RclHR1_12470006 [Rhizophagus clarus]
MTSKSSVTSFYLVFSQISSLDLDNQFFDVRDHFFLRLFKRDILTASSLCRILIVDTHVEFGSNETVLTTQLLTVYSSALWMQNLTRMIFDEPPIFECVDLMVCFFNVRIWRTVVLQLSERKIWQE